MGTFFGTVKRSLVAILVLFVLNLFLPFSTFAEMGTKARTGSSAAVTHQTAGHLDAKKLKAGAAKKARQKAFKRARSAKKVPKAKKNQAPRTMKKAEAKTSLNKISVASSSTSKRTYHLATNSNLNKHNPVYSRADRAKYGWWSQYR